MSQARIDYKLLGEFDSEAFREFEEQVTRRIREEDQHQREDKKPKRARRGRRR